LSIAPAATLGGVLAEDPKTRPAVRANRSHRRKTSPLLYAIPLVIVAVGVGLFLLLRGGNVDIPIIGGGDDPAPAFSFRVTKARGIATSEEADVESMNGRAAEIADEVTPVLDEMFTAAYLDPGNWRDGDYEQVWGFFTDDARAAAEAAVETLTLGTTAGDLYETVEPSKSTLSFEVLFDPETSPDSLVVRFRFTALGEHEDGTYTEVVSVGQLFMDDLGGWKVTAFDVARQDQEAEPPAPAPSATATPSA
jgi:hypothetical protein